MCVCILLSVLVHFLHLFPYLSISFLVPKFLSSFREKVWGEATFSQFPFFSTIVSLLKVSTFGQIEGGEKEIGQIEGGLGMALWLSGFSLGLLKSSQPLRDSWEATEVI